MKSSEFQDAGSGEVPTSNLQRPFPLLELCFPLKLTVSVLALILFNNGFAARADETNTPPSSALREFSFASKPIPFRDVVAATTHFQVVNFDTNNPAHMELRAKILRAAMLAGERSRTIHIGAMIKGGKNECFQ